MDLSGPAGAVVSASVIASLGTLWFAYVLKGLKSMAPIKRYGVYAGIWLAYFAAMMVFMRQTGAI